TWDIVKVDVSKAIKEFFMSGKLRKEVNHTIIALIPKVPSPTRVNDYRPISCCNVLFKCISKIISNRIKDSLTNLVNINQSAFVPGRRISDNLLLTQELMHNYHMDRGPSRCAFKVDIQKAYDTMDWNFLRQILIGKRGLRQGDPLSPYLFTLVMEILSLILKRKVCNSVEFIFHHHCSSLEIINLCFADYLFLFSHGDINSARVIIDALDEFKNVSGLVPSLPKSTTYFCNVLNHTKFAILNVLPFKEGTLPIKYLGVPLVSSRLAYRDCKELVEKVQNKINNWKNKFLSFAGILQLIQSVIASMHVYWSSIFILSSRIMSDIEQLMRSFLWCNGEMRRGKAKVAWEDICLPKDEGGLGIQRLDHFNVALISSHVWSILTRKEALWVKWIHTHKLRGRNFWDYPFRGNMTWGWRKILQIRPIIRKFIWYKIGNGSSISAWFDNWSMHSPVIQSITTRDLHAAGFSMQTTVGLMLFLKMHGYGLWLDIIKPFSVGTVWDDIRHHDNIMAWMLPILKIGMSIL
ncbi:hypothetical protein Tco_0570533, partial [Tanacetum coccineum]